MTPDRQSARMRDICALAPVIPVIVIDDIAHAQPLARALVAGGLPVLEVTLRTPVALDAIRAMSTVPGAVVGAGTVLSADDIHRARNAGATFAVAPGMTDSLIRTCETCVLPMLPGAATASEAMQVLEMGFDMLKFFPAGPAGGPSYLKALGGPLPGISLDVVDEYGKTVGNGEQGFLVVREPWPSMMRTIWGDDQRFIDTYWSRFEGMYFAGDGARFDEDGDIWVLGRVDDVMNVSGHRLSTSEIESALVSHTSVAEAAVVGAADETTGQAVVAFAILTDDAVDENRPKDELSEELRAHVGKEISPIAKPKRVLIVPELPKTRSGKIMRRLLKDVAEGRDPGDSTTLADPTVMQRIVETLAPKA